VRIPRRPPVPADRIPRGVWTLGFVSLFMDVSSEMIHALLPVFLVTALGASTLSVGLIEGTAEAIANVTKVFSGVLSDRIRRRKPLAVAGYALAAATKPIFALADAVGWVFAARFLDRVGKGVRGAPRDALVADLAPSSLRGRSFGLRQALDTVGAFSGPLAAIALMALTGNAFRTVFWIALLPAVVAVALLAFGVREPEAHRASDGPSPRVADVRLFGAPFWAVVGVAAVLTLARFSEAFLVLRAEDVGIPLTLVPVVMVVMSLAYSLSAYPAGAMVDRAGGREKVLLLGIAFLVFADLVLALGATVPLTLLGAAIWGLHMGFSQGLFATLVADAAPAELRGSAFGVFNLVVGIALLAASVLAGALWDLYGPMVTFLAGAGISCMALLGYVTLGATRVRRQG
jgi:MFS family permease